MFIELTSCFGLNSGLYLFSTDESSDWLCIYIFIPLNKQSQTDPRKSVTLLDSLFINYMLFQVLFLYP